MNYRHAYHAGNFADVVKHAVLVGLLESLKQKAAPFSYVETHAGAGRYNLAAVEAQKTQEYVRGIACLLGAARLPSVLHVYLNLVRALNTRAAAGQLVEYPGSPLIAALLARAEDRLTLCELQEAEAAALKLEFKSDARVAVHQRDGYAALKALLPPTPRRGLVLIDPPFEEQEREFDTIADALQAALKRWPTGTYAVWYPIKLRQHIAPFHRWLKQCGSKNVLVGELCLHPDNSALRLNGCGMAIVNAPYRFERTLSEVFPALLSLLEQGRYGQQSVQWLVQESQR
jgi:23S rRNA (adenine2030-N6)-methyltransferase